MALKDRLRSKRSKRFINVVNYDLSKTEGTKFSSSDSENEGLSSLNKVRKGFSTSELMRRSEFLNVDNDHIYTSLRPSVAKRQFSEESDEKPVKRKCFSKNAVMARLNRERKKRYVSSLETENESLRKENEEIIRKMEKQNEEISAMRREVLYLKGLLANSKELELILRSLREVTGLPVSSSVFPQNKTARETQLMEKSPVQHQEENVITVEECQPRIRSVTSGFNHPILDKDINLGSFSDNSCNALADFENYPFHFEDDYYDKNLENLTEDSNLYDFNPPNLDVGFEGSFKLDTLSENKDPEVGICLHINQKRISVELCSICNSKATATPLDLPKEVF